MTEFCDGIKESLNKLIPSWFEKTLLSVAKGLTTNGINNLLFVVSLSKGSYLEFCKYLSGFTFTRL